MATNTVEIRIIASGAEQVAKVLQGVADTGARLGSVTASGAKQAEAALGSFTSVAKTAADVMGRAGLQTGIFGQAIGALTSPLGIAAAATTALGLAIKGTTDFMMANYEQLRALQAVSGLSADAADQLADTFDLLGFNVEALRGAMFKMSTEIDSGGKNFRALGIDIRNAGGQLKSEGALFLEIRDRISDMGSAAQRNAALIDVFGRSGRELATVFALSADEFKAWLDKAGMMGPSAEKSMEITHEYALAVAELKKTFDSLVETVGQRWLPTLTQTAKTMTDAMNTTNSWGTSLSQWLDDLATKWENYKAAAAAALTGAPAPSPLRTADTMAKLGRMGGTFEGEGTGAIPTIPRAAKEELEKFTNQLQIMKAANFEQPILKLDQAFKEFSEKFGPAAAAQMKALVDQMKALTIANQVTDAMKGLDNVFGSLAKSMAALAQGPGLLAMLPREAEINQLMQPILQQLDAARLAILNLRDALPPGEFAKLLATFDEGAEGVKRFADAQARATVNAKEAADAREREIKQLEAEVSPFEALGTSISRLVEQERELATIQAEVDDRLAENDAAVTKAGGSIQSNYTDKLDKAKAELLLLAETFGTSREAEELNRAAFEIGGTTFENLSVDAQDLARQLAGIRIVTQDTASMKAYREELDAIGTAGQLLGRNFDVTSATLSVLQKRFDELNKSSKGTAPELQEIAARIDAIRAKNFADDLSQIAAAGQLLGQNFDATGAKISRLMQEFNDLNKATNGLGADLPALAAQINSLIDQQRVEQWVKSLTDGFGQMLELASKTASAMTQAFSDLFFDLFTGNLKSAAEIFHSFLNSLLRALSDFLAQAIVKEFVGVLLGTSSGSAGGLGALTGVIGNLLGGGGGASGTTSGGENGGGGFSITSFPTGLLNPGNWTALGTAFSTAWEVFNTGLEGGASFIGAFNSGASAFGEALGVSIQGISTFGTALAGLGAALAVFNGIMSLVNGQTAKGALTLGGVAGGAIIGGLLTEWSGPGMLIGAGLGGLIGSLFGGLFKPKLTHEQREQIEFGRTAQNLGPLVNALTDHVRTFDQLFNTLVDWASIQSSGGTHGQQVVTTVGGRVIAAPGTLSANEPGAITSGAALRQALLADPHALQVFVQQGIAQPMLDKLNTAIKAAVDAAIDLITQLDTVQNTVFPRIKQAIEFTLPEGPLKEGAQKALTKLQKEFVDAITSGMSNEDVEKKFAELQARLTTFGNFVSLLAQLQADSATITGNLAEQTRIGIATIREALSQADQAIVDAKTKLDKAADPDAQIAAGSELRDAILARYALEKQLIQQIEQNISNLLTSFGNHLLQMQIALDVSQLTRTGNGTAIVGLISSLQVMATTALSLSARVWAVQAGMAALIAAMEGLLRFNNMGMGGPLVGGGTGRTIGEILPDFFTAAQPFLDSLATIAGIQIGAGDLTGALQTLQQFDATAQEAANAALNMIEEWRKASIDAINAQLEADIEAINAKHNLEIKNAQDTMKRLIDADQAHIEGIQAAAKAQQDAINAQIEGIQTEIDAIQEAAQARQEAISAEIDALSAQQNALQQQISVAKEWENVVQNVHNLLTSLRLSPQAPINPADQLAEAQANFNNLLQQFHAAPTTELAAQLQQAAQTVLQLGASVFSRPSPQYQALFTSITDALEGVADVAKANVPASSADLEAAARGIGDRINDLRDESTRIGKEARDAAKALQDRIAELRHESQRIGDEAQQQVDLLQKNIKSIQDSGQAFIDAANAARDAEIAAARDAARNQIAAINQVADAMSKGVRDWLEAVLTGSAAVQQGLLTALIDSQNAQLGQLTSGQFTLTELKKAADLTNAELLGVGGTIGGGFADFIGGPGGVIHQTAATATEAFHINEKLDLLNRMFPAGISYLGDRLDLIVRNTGGGSAGQSAALGAWDTTAGPYTLHAGEMVLPRRIAEQLRGGGIVAASESGGTMTATTTTAGNNYTNNFYITAHGNDPKEIVRVLEDEIRYGKLGQAIKERQR